MYDYIRRFKEVKVICRRNVVNKVRRGETVTTFTKGQEYKGRIDTHDNQLYIKCNFYVRRKYNLNNKDTKRFIKGFFIVL